MSLLENERPSIFQRIRSWFNRPGSIADLFLERVDYDGRVERRDIRAFITIDGKTEVLGEYKQVTPDELDELTQQAQAKYTFNLMLKTKQPKAVFAQITIEEMK